jgi:ABC-type nitrate/sulfonate/bicarbonate transport system substrate-binding protein
MMEVTMIARSWLAAATASLAVILSAGCATTPQPPVALEAVIGNNFGHLPMFVGVDKGLFKKHGIDLKLKVVNTGTDIVLTSYTEAAQRTHPEYFADLPALPR